MNKIYTLALILLAGVFSLQVECFPEQEINTIRMASNNWYFWRFQENGQERGADIEIWQELTKRLGLTIQYEHANLRECEEKLKQGTVDIYPSLLRTDEREKYYHFLIPPFRTKLKYSFYIPNDTNSDIARYIDLKNMKIGLSRNSDHFKPFDDDPEITKDVEGNMALLFKKLEEGALDAICVNEWKGDHFLLTSGLKKKYKKATFSYSEYHPVYLVMSKKSNFISQVDEFEHVLKEMLADGTIRNIINNYVPGWYEPFQLTTPEAVGMSAPRIKRISSLA